MRLPDRPASAAWHVVSELPCAVFGLECRSPLALRPRRLRHPIYLCVSDVFNVLVATDTFTPGPLPE